MRQPKRNELWHYLKREHDLLLTLEEMDKIVKFAEDDKIDYIREVQEKINWYRVTNILLLLIFAIIGWEWGLRAIVFLFVAYNIFHVIYINWSLRKWRKQKMDERRRVGQNR